MHEMNPFVNLHLSQKQVSAALHRDGLCWVVDTFQTGLVSGAGASKYSPGCATRASSLLSNMLQAFICVLMNSCSNRSLFCHPEMYTFEPLKIAKLSLWLNFVWYQTSTIPFTKALSFRQFIRALVAVEKKGIGMWLLTIGAAPLCWVFLCQQSDNCDRFFSGYQYLSRPVFGLLQLIN